MGSRLQAILTYERACAADTTSLGHSDYSFKPVKSIINYEMNEYYTASMMTTAPFFYGAQPNLGLYFQPEVVKKTFRYSNVFFYNRTIFYAAILSFGTLL